MHVRSALLGVVTLALLGATSSLADVDVEVGNGDKITGTLSPATEAETFRVRVPKGAKLTIKAKAAKKGPGLHVILNFPQAAALTADGKTASISTVASQSGLYAVTVTSQDGVTVGDYSLTISWKSQSSFTKTTDLANAQTDTLTFAADAGATATITAKPGKKSKATGVLSQLTAPDFTVTPYAAAAAKLLSTTAGEYALAFGNSGATQGLVTATVKLKLPKAPKRKLTLTSKVIGSGDPLGDSAFAAVLGAQGGSVTVPFIGPGQPGAAISGSSVSVPPGALANGSTIFIATAPDVHAPGTVVDAGPTVAFGPEGLKFDAIDKTAKATVKIPYDPVFDSSTSTIVIYTRDAKGKVTAVPQPYTFDKTHHTISFSTSHFSAFQAAGPQVVPQFTLDTLVTLNDPRDVCLSHDPATALRVVYYVAGGTDNVVTALRTGVQPGPLVVPETYVGGGADTSDGAPRLQFKFVDPVQSVFATQTGLLYVATSRQIFRVSATGNVNYVAGSGVTGDFGDNGPASQAKFTSITSILVTATQQIYVADSGANRIRFINGTQITAFAGTGATAVAVDGPDILTTTFNGPIDMDFDGVGPGLYVTDGGRVRHLSPGTSTGINVTIAGGSGGEVGSTGDGGPLLQARFLSLQGIVHYIDPFNPGDFVLLVNDKDDHTMRKLNLTQNVVTLGAGQHGQPGFGGNIDVSTGLINGPTQLCHASNDVIFVDSLNAKIRVQTLLQ